MTLNDRYITRRNDFLSPAAAALETFIKDILAGVPRIDRVSVRAKNVESFINKSKKIIDCKPKYEQPLDEIQDQIGARVIVYFLDDVEVVASKLTRYFSCIESQSLKPDNEKEFGYEGKHFIFLLPADVSYNLPAHHDVKFFELQIKTLFQHAWSEAEHDVGYKTVKPLSVDQKRQLAFTAAQSWGADKIFQSLKDDLEY